MPVRSDYRYRQVSTTIRSNRRLQGIIGALATFVLLAVIWVWMPRHPPQAAGSTGNPAFTPQLRPAKGQEGGRPTYTFSDGTTYEKPLEIKVYGLVFYGRWDRVQILDCYLKKNLAKNGGFLDKVVFVSNTPINSDLEALERLLSSEPDGYMRGQAMHPTKDSGDFHNAWEGLEPDVLYIKIDDDTVYIADAAIPRIIQYRIAHPTHLLISANVVNSPALSWVHERVGALHPFLPEKTSDRFNPNAAVSNWRPSKLPKISHATHSGRDFDAPSRPHRWLPVDTSSLAAKDVSNDYTPASIASYSAWGAGWNDWRLAAQEHYSFFQNAEMGTLRNYEFERWDMNYDRLSINFIAVWGRDVIAALPMPRDDEEYLTQTVSKRTGRHVVVAGRALVVHYAYGAQKEGLGATDVLQRYKAFAKEMCGKLLA